MFSMFRFLMGDKSVVCRIIRLLILILKIYVSYVLTHIHIFIKATPSDSISHIVSQLKGYTSFILRNEFEMIRKRLPSLWTRSFYVETIGHISESVIKKYIDDQKKY